MMLQARDTLKDEQLEEVARLDDAILQSGTLTGKEVSELVEFEPDDDERYLLSVDYKNRAHEDMCIVVYRINEKVQRQVEDMWELQEEGDNL